MVHCSIPDIDPTPQPLVPPDWDYEDETDEDEYEED